MSSSVFGTRVTKAMLRGMPEYRDKNSISQLDLAQVALEQVNVESKAADARTFLEKLQYRFGDDQVSTKYLMYNATGANMTFEFSYDISGRLCESSYPVIVANGQWAGFLHGQYYGDKDKNSSAIVAYSALNKEGKKMLWLMYFSTSISGLTNKVITAIWDPSKYDLNSKKEIKSSFEAFKSSIEAGSLEPKGPLVYVANENGGYLSGSIGNTAKPVFEAVLTLPEAVFD